MKATRRRVMVAAAAMLLTAVMGSSGCGASSARPRAAAAVPSASESLPPCDPAAADQQKQGMPTPAPCFSVDPNQQFRDNTLYLRRMQPKPADATALRGAATDLERVFGDLRAHGLYDPASVQSAILPYPTLKNSLVHAPSNERLSTRDPTVVVVLEHGSACLLGEHGPTESVANVVGHTNDGGCEAKYGH